MDAFEALSTPEQPSHGKRRFFTVEQANRALPLVRRIVADIVREYARLRGLAEQIQSLEDAGRREQIREVRDQYLAVAEGLSDLRDELEEIGCELKDYEVGLIDFPALLDGRRVYLCWKHGEPRIDFWHELQAGFAGRQPLPKALL